MFRNHVLPGRQPYIYPVKNGWKAGRSAIHGMSALQCLPCSAHDTDHVFGGPTRGSARSVWCTTAATTNILQLLLARRPSRPLHGSHGFTARAETRQIKHVLVLLLQRPSTLIRCWWSSYTMSDRDLGTCCGHTEDTRCHLWDLGSTNEYPWVNSNRTAGENGVKCAWTGDIMGSEVERRSLLSA